jgi:hypothetical protein
MPGVLLKLHSALIDDAYHTCADCKHEKSTAQGVNEQASDLTDCLLTRVDSPGLH